MEIVSYQFAIFAIISGLIFYLLNHKYRIAYLATLSCGFIASYSYYILVYVLIYTLINYFIALKIPDSKHKKRLYIAGIVLNLSQLILLRYASFAIDPVFRLFDSNVTVSKISEIIIPIGISYFTLQGIGYLINVKMGWEKPEKNFLYFLLYITFFPKFMSGPIERSNHFLPQLREVQTFNEKHVTDGLRIALFGFFKKIAIANQLAPYIGQTYTNIDSADSLSLITIFLIQPLYLYFDFSGYTDIAVGFARIFGVQLLPNFNRPFFSENMTNFWKRFHISLSSWFNDYIFKQTSFKYRKWGVYASVFALFVTWTLFGIWHGAGWTFMLLGVLQAIAITYEFFTKKWRAKLFSKFPNLIRIWLGRIFTYLFYCVCMIFFFAPNISSVFLYISKLTQIKGPFMITDPSLKPMEVIIYIPVFLLLELIQNDYKNIYDKLENSWLSDKTKNKLFRWFIYSVIITIMFIVGFKAQQFIYADF
jgi:alginate O-acetyltransferase complex protein AlgI